MILAGVLADCFGEVFNHAPTDFRADRGINDVPNPWGHFRKVVCYICWYGALFIALFEKICVLAKKGTCHLFVPVDNAPSVADHDDDVTCNLLSLEGAKDPGWLSLILNPLFSTAKQSVPVTFQVKVGLFGSSFILLELS